MCDGNLHFNHDYDKLHQLCHRRICCNNRSYCLCIMSCCNLRCDDWIECLYCLHCWFLLRHDGFISCDWKLCSRIIFSFVGKCLLFLLGWNLHFNGISIELLELFQWNFRRIGWIECLYCLYSWFLLRHDGFISYDWKLCSRVIFSVVGKCLLFLRRQHILVKRWSQYLHSLFRF